MLPAEQALALVAGELARRSPGLPVTMALDRPGIPVLEVRTPLIAEGVARVHVAYRPDGYVMMATEPIGGATGATAHLRSPDPAAVAGAIAEWATRPLRVQLPRPPGPAEMRKRVAAMVKKAQADAAAPPRLLSAGDFSADPAAVAFHFPRDRRGRMLGKAAVLLEVLEAGNPGRRSRCRFLRLRAGAFETYVSDEFVENQDHRWHRQPWRWRRDAVGWPAAERWGVAGVEAAVQAAEDLEAGRFQTGFGAFGVRLGPSLVKVLGGEPLHPTVTDLTASWGTVAAEELSKAAPWRLPVLAGKTWMRLFGLGGIGAQSKPVIALGISDGAPVLDYASLGSNRRLAREDWERSLDFEAVRLGLEARP